MLADYKDIRSRISEAPAWFDSHGVPRYDKFNPELCPDIYAHEVILFRIACQACGKRFLVEEHNNFFSSLVDDIRNHRIHYGDPPRHGCVGDTMNCDDIKIIEYWHRGSEMKWERIKELEIDLEDVHDNE